MQFSERRKIAVANGSHGFVEGTFVIGVRQEIPMGEHIDPDLPIADDASRKGGLDHGTRGCWVDNLPLKLQVVLHGLPSELYSELKPLHRALLLECRESLDSALDRFTQEIDGPIEVLKTLLPADILSHEGFPCDFQ